MLENIGNLQDFGSSKRISVGRVTKDRYGLGERRQSRMVIVMQNMTVNLEMSKRMLYHQHYKMRTQSVEREYASVPSEDSHDIHG